MLERQTSALSLRRQCELLKLSRSGVYYESEEPSPEEEKLMRQIDQQYLKTPFYGSRRMTQWLRTQGHLVNRKRVQRLMRRMGLEGLAPGPKTSEAAPEHVKYPYLLRKLEIHRANHVWAADITYIPLAHGFVYLVVIMDWYSRYVLSWRLSNTLDSSFCVDALQDALEQFGKPSIFNTDQGVQFTSYAFITTLRQQAIRISMDGKGRCIDNVFVERIWRSLKYEEIYLHAYEDVLQARKGIGAYFVFYNEDRPHQALGYHTPGQLYRESLALHMVA